MGCTKELATRMEQRSEQVRHAGQYLGLFEWVAWSVMRRAVVQMLFGSQVVDVVSVFAPSLCQESGFAPIHRVAAVLLDRTGFWRSAGGSEGAMPHINHFVIGAVDAGASVKVHHALDDKTKYMGRCVLRHALNVGWVPWASRKPTHHDSRTHA